MVMPLFKYFNSFGKNICSSESTEIDYPAKPGNPDVSALRAHRPVSSQTSPDCRGFYSWWTFRAKRTSLDSQSPAVLSAAAPIPRPAVPSSCRGCSWAHRLAVIYLKGRLAVILSPEKHLCFHSRHKIKGRCFCANCVLLHFLARSCFIHPACRLSSDFSQFWF